MSLKAAGTKSGNPGQQKHWLVLWDFLFPSGSGPAKSGRLLCALRECIKAETFALRLEPFQNVNPRNYRFFSSMDFGKTGVGAAEREVNLRGAFDFGETQ